VETGFSEKSLPMRAFSSRRLQAIIAVSSSGQARSV